MSEADAISRANLPRTRATLAADFRRLGVRPGMCLLVHSSLSAIGWVAGGPVAVIQALQDVLTAEGTLMMPAHSTDNSDPAQWRNPAVPAAWIDTIRTETPAYDPRITPTRNMGVIAELFRRWPGVLRSEHPQLSFAAWGHDAERVTAGHRLENGLGEHSPLARLYDLEGHVLLLGVGYNRNTSFHLSEYRAPGSKPERQGAAVLVDGERVWKWFADIETDSELFPTIGAAFEATGRVTVGKVGSATARLFSQVEAVDFAEKWLADWREEQAEAKRTGRRRT